MNYNNKPRTVKDLLQWAVLFLGKEKRLEVELLLAQVCSYSRAKLLAYPEEILTEAKIEKFIKYVNRRKQGEPLQYLTGKQNFMGLEFKVTPDVLVPRSDTEVLVEEVINLANKIKKPVKILDLCTGSGAIAISLAKHIQDSELVATDISREALAIARYNAAANGVEKKVSFIQGDLFQPLNVGAKFKIIVSNPPYISTQEMEELPADVKKEPQIALWGGKDGLDFYQAIIKNAPNYLEHNGYLFLEIGYRQGEAVQNICWENGFTECQVSQDWGGYDRVIKAFKK